MSHRSTSGLASRPTRSDDKRTHRATRALHAAGGLFGAMVAAALAGCGGGASPQSVAEAPFVTLRGAGLTDRWAAGCTPTQHADFIDGGSWTPRRVAPQDCARVITAAPVFRWPEPTDRDAGQLWQFELKDADSAKRVLQVQTVAPWLVLWQPLAPGNYAWHVSYRARGGQVVSSEPRRLAIDAASAIVTFPAGAAFAATVAAKPHPRVIPSGADAASMAARAAASPEHAGMLAALMAEAQRALAAPIPSPDAGTSSQRSSDGHLDAQGKVALRSLLSQERRYIEALGVAAAFSGDARLRARGVERLRQLAMWSPEGPTSEANFDLANSELYRGLAQGLDLFWDDLSSSERQQVTSPLKARLAQARARLEELAANPYSSHADIIAWSVLEGLMYSVGAPGFPEAPAWLADTWALLQVSANTWGEDDGGFGNGVAYGWWRMEHIAPVLAGIRVMAGVDFTRQPWIQRFGDYLIAMTEMNGTQRNAFGDGIENNTLYADYGQDEFRVYAQLTGRPQHAWYAGLGAAPSAGGYKSPWNLLLLGLDLNLKAGVAPTRATWLFADAGVVSMHDDVAATGRSSLFFRSSDFGSWNHSHADQNAFTLVSHGKDLLISGGYYPYFLSPHHATDTRATRYKNALTFDGGVGQAEPQAGGPGAPLQSRDFRGQLLNFHDKGSWSVATGDAALAYRYYDSGTQTLVPLLDNAVRSVAYNRAARVAVVYDWATSRTARRWELNFNAPVAFAVGPKTASVVNGRASACLDVYGLDGSFSTHRGFDIPPEDGSADQFQARFNAASATGRLVAVTVIREDCHAAAISVDFAGTQALVHLDGRKELGFDRRSVSLFQERP